MAWLRDLLETCDFFVRKHLDDDEEVLATGRCEDITTTGSIASGGAGWTYVMVTTKRVRWRAVSEADWMVFTRTKFAFSHPDTRAAVTLRQELLRRGHTL
jgi:hypothetical protein